MGLVSRHIMEGNRALGLLLLGAILGEDEGEKLKPGTTGDR